ncbi:MAG: hypothetical protein JO337_12820 [Acidimicrobiales bacterium]|nr:hypothetical protein [Acidimicrobiales bacterium]
MRHASDGVLRRLEDEPFAIADSTFEHIRHCRRCTARRHQIAGSAGIAARLLSGPRPAPDVERGWQDLQERLGRSGLTRSPAHLAVRSPGRRRRRGGNLSVRTAVVAGALVVTVAGGAAAAATVTGVFAPTRVAPVAVTPSDFQAISSFMSFSDTSGPAGLPTSNGTGYLPFGSLRWASVGQGRQVGSLAEAESLAGIRIALPGRLPAGVGSPMTYVVQPKLTVSVTFDSAAGSLAGASAVMNLGPAIFVGYGSRSGAAEVPTLGILTLPRPTATSTGATIGQIENFLLSQRGVPANLAEELRLLGNISNVLPVPAPAGMVSKSVQVGSWPGVVMSDRSQVASAVVWEDGAGVVHAVAGLVDQQGVLSVADQLR